MILRLNLQGLRDYKSLRKSFKLGRKILYFQRKNENFRITRGKTISVSNVTIHIVTGSRNFNKKYKFEFNFEKREG